MKYLKKDADETTWAIEQALAAGVTPEQIAHNIFELTSRHEAIRLIRQLLIDKTEYSADLHDDDGLVMSQLYNTLNNLSTDVQQATIKYMKNE